MKRKIYEKNIEELTLPLMYLTPWDDKGYVEYENGSINEEKIKKCWKGYDFNMLNDLTDKGYLYLGKYKNKSVILTNEGEELAKQLIEKYLK